MALHRPGSDRAPTGAFCSTTIEQCVPFFIQGHEWGIELANSSLTQKVSVGLNKKQEAGMLSQFLFWVLLPWPLKLEHYQPRPPFWFSVSAKNFTTFFYLESGCQCWKES
jgi:hypothetical protein